VIVVSGYAAGLVDCGSGRNTPGVPLGRAASTPAVRASTVAPTNRPEELRSLAVSSPYRAAVAASVTESIACSPGSCGGTFFNAGGSTLRLTSVLALVSPRLLERAASCMSLA
jgi:hypothetical protein